MIERPNHVRVKNTHDATIVGRFAGVDYHFKKGDPVDISMDAARHIFGFGLDDKAQAMARLGWATSSDKMDAALERLGKVSFSKAPPLVEADLAEPPAGASASDAVPKRIDPVGPTGGDRGTAAPAAGNLRK